MSVGSGKKDQIANALKIVKQISAGDFESRILNIQTKGDLGELFHTINDMIDRFDAYVRESQACMSYISNNQYYRKIIETSMNGVFLTASETTNAALDAMQEKVSTFEEITDSFESTSGEVVGVVGKSSEALKQSAASLIAIADDTTGKASSVTVSSEEVTASVQTVAAASEELTASINDISQQICSTATTFTEASAVSKEVMGQVNELQKAGAQISSVVDLIQNIAAQTNLLALNATIEAARAGEAGKGFAVVASEVKSLAQETSKATEEISGYVQNIQMAMKNTTRGIESVADKVEEIHAANTSISSAVEEQSAATSEIARNIEHAASGTKNVSENIVEVSSSASKTGESASEVNSASENLSKSGEELRQVIGDFLVKARAII